ncbi:Riboflavin transporter RibU [bioreactor metagenome]|uniref:Riboflavin transporter RibU n=1 Tax=bioreactor metagenome TaxID=1076179 RepID=A0A644X679_9ZZZZ|nr:ECF transporter S component [Clostridia bacterium]
MKQKSLADRLAKLGMLTALSVLLVYAIHFPIFPAASFLEYDMADVPILIGTFLYGPWWGLALTAVVSLLQWLLVSPQSMWVGAVMHFCATGSYVIAAGLIYGKMRTLKGALIGMAVGSVLQTAMMIPMNLIFTVHFFGVPKETVLTLLPTAIIPFNAIKTVANSILTFLLYKRVEKLLKKEIIKSPVKQAGTLPQEVDNSSTGDSSVNH